MTTEPDAARWPRRARPPLLDLCLAAGFTAVALLVGGEQHPPWRALDTVGYALTILANMPTAYRRRAPVVVWCCCTAVWVLYINLGYWPALNVYGGMLALYTVAAMRPRKVALTLGVLGSVVWTYAGLLAEESSIPSVIILAIVFTSVLWKFGDNARQLDQRNRKLAEVTEQLRLEQADRAYRAVADERMRIAAELHDVVAHHTSIISVQAGMADYVFATDPQSARGAIGVIATTSREAQQELRRMLTLLRHPGPTDRSHPPAAGVKRLDELVARMRAAGVPTGLVVSGRPRPLPPGLDLCVYRVVQESLTNVLKHAGPASATVSLKYLSDQLIARVTDDGQHATGPDPIGSGHGLVGMHERARLYGGTVNAGPHPPGGFQVTLTLPLPHATE